MTAAFRQRFFAELNRHGLHLEYNLSIYLSPNTHLLGVAVAPNAMGRLFSRADRWRRLGHEVVRDHMTTCVKNDADTSSSRITITSLRSIC